MTNKTDIICIGMALVDSIIKGFNPEPISESGYRAVSGSLAVGGEAVNEAIAAADLWDGTVDGGGPAPQGTYVYFCRYAYSASAYYTANGTVTLIR